MKFYKRDTTFYYMQKDFFIKAIGEEVLLHPDPAIRKEFRGSHEAEKNGIRDPEFFSNLRHILGSV